MSSFGNNGAFGDDRDRVHYTSNSWQQNAPIIDDSSRSGLHRYVPAGPAPNTSSWPSTTFPVPSPVYGGVAWSGDQRFDEARLGSLFGAPGGNADGSRMNLVGMEIAAPVSEQAFPTGPRASPSFQPWTQAPGSPWHWDPLHTVGHQRGSDHSSPIGSFAMKPDVPPVRQAASSLFTGGSERSTMPTGPPPSITTPNSVWPSTHSDPVPAAPSTFQSRGERWDLSNESTFRCLWTDRGTGCLALIGGNRRSVTNHLRDEHNFACDGQMIECPWDECTAYMQRRNIPRHIVACHFAIKVTCPQCGLTLSRADANKKHQSACPGAQTPGMEEVAEGGYF